MKIEAAWPAVDVSSSAVETASTNVGMVRTNVATAATAFKRVPVKVGGGCTVGGTAATGGKLLCRVRAFDPELEGVK